MVGIRALQLRTSPTHRDARRSEARTQVPHTRLSRGVRGAHQELEDRRSATPARSRESPHPCVCDTEHAQNADLLPAGQHDPHLGRGFRAQVRGELPRSIHDAHQHQRQLPDPGEHGCGSSAGGVRRLRAGGKSDRARAALAAHDPREPAFAEVVRHHHHQRSGAARTPPERIGHLLPARSRVERDREGLGGRRVRGGPHEDQPVHRENGDRRRHLQEQILDGQAPDPSEQDLAELGAFHDQHRHHARIAGLPHQSLAEHRRRAGTAQRRFRNGGQTSAPRVAARTTR